MAILSFIFPSIASPFFFNTSFCAIILSSDLFLFQKLSSQFFFVHDPPLFAHPFYTPALHNIFHTLHVADLWGPATWFNNRMPPLFHSLTSMIPFYTFHDSTFWIPFSLFFVLFRLLAPWHFVLSLLIPCKLQLTWFGLFLSGLVKPLACACTI